jgi:hypothetical protein
MDWLEQELKQALARKEPDAGFEGRVRRRQVRVMPRWIGIAAMIAIAIGGGEAYRWHRGQVAKEQVMTAMRLAGDSLSRVQMQVNRGTRQ